MKIALLSDVHGNLPGLQAVIDDLQSYQPDLILVAGDLIAGPYPNETLSLLSERGAVMIKGNTDLTLLRFVRHETPEQWHHLRQFGLMQWNARNVSAKSLAFLESLPEQRVIALPGTDPIRLVHGSPRDPYESILPEQDISVLDRSLEMITEPVLAHGHTHQPYIQHRDGKVAVNPGAVAGPLNGEVGAQYARLEWHEGRWEADLRLVKYDLALIRYGFEESGLLEQGGPVARCFLASHENGKDSWMAFLNFAYQMVAEAGIENCSGVPDEILSRAEAEFNWSEWC